AARHRLAEWRCRSRRERDRGRLRDSRRQPRRWRGKPTRTAGAAFHRSFQIAGAGMRALVKRPRVIASVHLESLESRICLSAFANLTSRITGPLLPDFVADKEKRNDHCKCDRLKHENNKDHD